MPLACFKWNFHLLCTGDFSFDGEKLLFVDCRYITLYVFAIPKFIWENVSSNTVLSFLPFDAVYLSYRNVLLFATPLTACLRAGYSLCDLNWTVPLLPCSPFQSTIRIITMENRNCIQRIRFDPIRNTLFAADIAIARCCASWPSHFFVNSKWRKFFSRWRIYRRTNTELAANIVWW